MKNKLLLLLLISSFGFAQTNPTAFNKLKITGNEKDNTATRVIVQDSITKELKWVLKNSIKSPIAKSTISGTVKTTTDVADPFVYNTIETDAKLLLKEDKTNKQNSLTADGTNTKYPTVTAVNTGLAAKQNTISGTNNRITKFTGANTIGNSSFSESTATIYSTLSYLQLADTGGFIFASTKANGWADNVSSRFFQVGEFTSYGIFSGQSGNLFERLAFASKKTQFTDGSYISLAVPTGMFEVITSGVKALSVVPASGNVLVRNATDDGTNFNVNGSAKVSSLTISTTPTTSTGSPDIVTRNTSTGAVERVPYSVIRPYKVYTALISQSGTDAPVATVLENTLGANITWSRLMEGQYMGTASLPIFSINKLTTSYGRTNINTLVRLDHFGTTSVFLGSALVSNAPSSIFSDNLLLNTSVEIRVYN